MEKHTFFATAAFGLEGIVARELRNIGLDAKAENGGAVFEGTYADAFLANLHLRTADRVLLVVGAFHAESFEELFEGVRALPWENYLTENTRFPVSGNCARSTLMSIRDCQAITKKAIVERLKMHTRCDWFPEDAETMAVSVTLHANIARLTLDTSGTALNRRGYRTWNGEAPLRETLAAALVDLSPWRPGIPLVDPFCGTGTLLIEAAMRMSHRAPGLTRSFALCDWQNMPFHEFDRIRQEAEEAFQPSLIEGISGSDIDPGAIELAQRHLKQAGLTGRVHLSVSPVSECNPADPKGVFLCNPPYGERISDRKSCEELYREMGKLYRNHPGWSMSAITSHPGFERCFGARADQKKRFYNGRLECEFMTFRAKHS